MEGPEQSTEDDMLTETEKRIVKAANESGWPISERDINDPRYTTEIRESMSRTAYHEAGHFAARCFTQLEITHVVKISIMPDEYTLGRITSERELTRWSFHAESLSPVSQEIRTWKRADGIRLLLHDLAGYGADVLSDPDGEWESLCDYYDENYFEDDWEESDLAKSYETANLMAPGYMPASRIIRLADRWTLEMLRIPAVWNIVEVTRKRLVEHGELTFHELEDLAWDCKETIHHIPKWRRRVFKELAKKITGRAAA